MKSSESNQDMPCGVVSSLLKFCSFHYGIAEFFFRRGLGTGCFDCWFSVSKARFSNLFGIIENMLSFILSFLLGIFLVVISIVMIVARKIFGISLFGHRRKSQASAQNQGGASYGQQPRDPNRREGEVSIDYVPPREDFRNARPAPGGPNDDYVEFEEVREERNGN